MNVDEDYEREHLHAFVQARKAGEADATSGKVYMPMRVPYHEHRQALSVDAYMGGWIDAVCERSRWRHAAFVVFSRLADWAVRVGPGRRGLG